MERTTRPAVATFFAGDEQLAAGGIVSLGEEVARHVRVLRLGPGAAVNLLDGAGRRAAGTVVRSSREAVAVQVETVVEEPPPQPIHLLVPVADRDRMLWLAEKVAELALTSWRPVLWRRSRSVKPRGEGATFAGRVRARMISALEQSGTARLPSLYPEATPERAVAAVPEGTRVMLDATGSPILGIAFREPVTIALGPEGGFDETERALLLGAGFSAASLGDTILRFETAAIAALGIARATLSLANRSIHGR